MKVKTLMALFPNADPCWILAGLDVDCRRYVFRCSWDPTYKWLLPVIGVDEEPLVNIHWAPCLRRGGVDISLLQPFDHESSLSKDSSSGRTALVNARSLANKSWIGVGELSVFFRSFTTELYLF